MLSTSETVKDLETYEGRRLLHEFYHDRRVKNAVEAKTLLECWRLCRQGTDLQFGDGRRVRFETNLGFKLGTRIFFEEIIGRFYYNSVVGFVYAGAMVVLLAVAFYLAGYSLWYAVSALVLEALLLLMLAVVTAYTANEETVRPQHAMGLSENLQNSMHSSIREMTNAVSDLFRLISQTDIRQDVLLTRLTENLGKQTSENTRKYSDRLEQTNTLLRELSENSRLQFERMLEQQRLQLEATRRLVEILEKKEPGA